MSFELDAKGGCVDEGSPSLLHEAMDHVRNTWSNVLSGRASAGEYVEAAVEVAVVAAGALAIRQGSKLVAARFGAAGEAAAAQMKGSRNSFEALTETEHAVLKELRDARLANAEYLKTVRRSPDGAIILDWMPSEVSSGNFVRRFSHKPDTYLNLRNAAKGDLGGLGGKMALGPNGLPYVAAESRFGSRVAEPELFAKIQDAAKGDLKHFSKKPLGHDARPIGAVDRSLALNLKEGLKVAGAADIAGASAAGAGLAKMKPIPPLSTSAGIPPYVHKVGAIEKLPMSKPGPVEEVIGLDFRQRPINVRIVSK